MYLHTENPLEPNTRPNSFSLPGNYSQAIDADYVVLPRHGWYLPVKAVLEFVLAVLISILITPILLLGAALVKLTSRGPAIFWQTRVGKDGKNYTIFKLRTMQHNCEALTGPQWSVPGDPRITPIGRFLRVTHIDEFPQIWNVLRGEMSLIGPRPERPEFVEQLVSSIPNYRNRLAVRPGITGLAQVNLPPDSDVASVRRKLAHDLYYLYQANPWLDFRILVCTAFSSMGLPSWCLRPLYRALRMPTEEAIKAHHDASSADLPVLDSVPAIVSEATA